MDKIGLVGTKRKESGKAQEQDDLFVIRTQIAIAKYEQLVPPRPHDKKDGDGKHK